MTFQLILETTQESLMLSEVRKRLLRKSFFGFQGDMGAGKTTFVSRLLSGHGVSVTSPTFALYNSYLVDDLEIVHGDLYRLNSAADVDSSGFWDLFGTEHSAILIEWVDRINGDDIPMDWQKWIVKIRVNSDQSRTYSLFSGSL